MDNITTTINMNDYVEVQLTDKGFDVWAQAWMPTHPGGVPDSIRQSADVGGGWFRFQWHDLMRTFGHAMQMGFVLPFATNVRAVPSAFTTAVAPSTPGARQAKAEIPTDEQRVKQARNRIETHYVYVDWASAGGPNECSHGFAAGIPCPHCDRLLVPASLPAEGPSEVRQEIERDNQRIADTISRGTYFQDWRLASLAANQGHRGLMVTTAGDFVVYSSSQDLEAQDAIRSKPVTSLPAEGVALPELNPTAEDADFAWRAVQLVWHGWDKPTEPAAFTTLLSARLESAYTALHCREREAGGALSESAALRKQLEEAIRERDGWKREADWLRRENGFHSDWVQHGFWRWQGDGNDHLESLTCGVAISPAGLQAIITRAETAEAKLKETV